MAVAVAVASALAGTPLQELDRELRALGKAVHAHAVTHRRAAAPSLNMEENIKEAKAVKECQCTGDPETDALCSNADDCGTCCQAAMSY